MLIGIIGDIHSNIDALRATYKKFKGLGVEKIICCGDIIGLGAHPDECVDFLRSIEPELLSVIRGNHESYFLDQLPVYNHNDPSKEKLPEEILELFRWNHGQISEQNADWLRKLPIQEIVEIDGIRIYNSHYPTLPNGKHRRFFMTPNLFECEYIFDGINADVYLFGHTHCRVKHHSRDGRLYINPGSNGCPIETNSASAGILNIEGGQATYTQLDIDYDIEYTISDMLSYAKELPTLSYTVSSFYRED